MKLENIKKYVYYYADNYPSLSILKSTFWLFAFLSFIALVYSIVSTKFICGTVLTSLTLLYGIAILVLQKKCQTPYFILRFWVKGTLGTVMSLVFLLLTLTILETTGRISVAYVVSIILAYIIILAVLFLITLLLVKNGRYNESRQNRKRKAGQIAGGLLCISGALGIGIAKFVFRGMQQDTVVNILIFMVFLVVIACSMGTTEYLKCYFILHYDVVSQKDWKHGSEDLMRHTQSKPWILGRIFLIFCIIVFSLAIFGLILKQVKG